MKYSLNKGEEKVIFTGCYKDCKSGNLISKSIEVKKMKQPKFFRCEICGNLAEPIIFSGVTMHCCGQPMTELVANTIDASKEKHVSVVETKGKSVLVKIGEVAHPMIKEHYIQWIYVLTNLGIQRKDFQSNEKPEFSFELKTGEKIVSVYEYCNLHSLWKTDLKK